MPMILLDLITQKRVMEALDGLDRMEESSNPPFEYQHNIAQCRLYMAFGSTSFCGVVFSILSIGIKAFHHVSQLQTSGASGDTVIAVFASDSQRRFVLAAVELNGAIYATGGFDGNDYLRSAERFDPRDHSWTKIPNMNVKRGCHSLVVLNEKLYALGGFDGDKMVPSIEVFDPRLGAWTIRGTNESS
ncbi:hypothetical protein JHK87_018591 [Glycine soja]|nr:hypothetical protein JHK87_018591 [Glycine soja]